MKMIVTVLSCCAMLLSSCTRSNNLLLGRVEAVVGSHTVAVTDCYRISVPPPQKLEDSSEGKAAYRFTPCRDADIVIRSEELIVNGKSYGHLNEADAVTVDHGKVLISASRDARAR
jgi:hypothetical protein